MNAEQWLDQIGKLDRLIDAMLAERTRLMALATDISPKPMDGMPFSDTGSDPHKMENAIIKVVELSREIERITDQYIDKKKEVLAVLQKLPEKEYAVLHKHYVLAHTFEQIADEMGYCVRQILRIKKNGLQILEDVIECHSNL